MEKPSCKLCKFSMLDADNVLFCKRFPPVYGDNHKYGFFPAVRIYDFCGEFTRKKDKSPEFFISMDDFIHREITDDANVYRNIIKKYADKIRKEYSGSLLYGHEIDVNNPDELLVACYFSMQ